MSDQQSPHKRLGANALIESAQRKYERQLICYAQIFVARRELAAEIVQETFLKLFQQTEPPNDVSLAAWLFRVCRNLAIDVQRREKRMNTDTAAVERTESDRSCDPAAIASDRETVQRLQMQLAKLTKNQQEVIRLKFQNGFSYREISEVTGLSISNVGVQLHEAIQRLRNRLEPNF
jgi:RNA polymerase sigma factor (sigma-70 family)